MKNSRVEVLGKIMTRIVIFQIILMTCSLNLSGMNKKQTKTWPIKFITCNNKIPRYEIVQKKTGESKPKLDKKNKFVIWAQGAKRIKRGLVYTRGPKWSGMGTQAKNVNLLHSGGENAPSVQIKIKGLGVHSWAKGVKHGDTGQKLSHSGGEMSRVCRLNDIKWPNGTKMSSIAWLAKTAKNGICYIHGPKWSGMGVQSKNGICYIQGSKIVFVIYVAKLNKLKIFKGKDRKTTSNKGKKLTPLGIPHYYKKGILHHSSNTVNFNENSILRKGVKIDRNVKGENMEKINIKRKIWQESERDKSDIANENIDCRDVKRTKIAGRTLQDVETSRNFVLDV